MQFVEGYREQNSPQRSAAKPSKEESCDSKDASKGLAQNTTFTPGRTGGTTGESDSNDTTAKTVGNMGDRDTSSDTDESFTSSENGADFAPGTELKSKSTSEGRPSVLNQSNAALMGDAPACDVCGSITVRNGTCYKCLNCGNSMGCS